MGAITYKDRCIIWLVGQGRFYRFGMAVPRATGPFSCTGWLLSEGWGIFRVQV